MLISDQYRAENARQHTESTGYGEKGYKHLQDILYLIQREGCKSALDYGCGKASLSRHAKRVSEVPIQNYDPAIPEYNVEPTPVDLVVCTDVLEHIEPLCLNSVLEHIAVLAQKAVYLQIATRPAKRILSDGRNAHLLVREPYFWLDNLRNHFDIIEMRVIPDHSMIVLGKPYGSVYK